MSAPCKCFCTVACSDSSRAPSAPIKARIKPVISATSFHANLPEPIGLGRICIAHGYIVFRNHCFRFIHDKHEDTQSCLSCNNILLAKKRGSLRRRLRSLRCPVLLCTAACLGRLRTSKGSRSWGSGSVAPRQGKWSMTYFPQCRPLRRHLKQSNSRGCRRSSPATWSRENHHGRRAS